MRRSLLLVSLLVAPSIAHADDPGIQPGQMSAEFDRLYRYAGCAVDFRSCSTVELHVRVIPGSYQPGRDAWVTYENFQSVWFDGTTAPYQLYGPSGGCALGGLGTASATLAPTVDSDNGGCEEAKPNDWTPSPGVPIGATIVLNPTSLETFTSYHYDMHLIPVTTTPEPASVVFMASGLVGVFTTRRRR
jgi:hypothetical protein